MFLDGVAKLKQAAAGNGPLLHLLGSDMLGHGDWCSLQSLCLPRAPGRPSRQGSVTRGNPGLCIVLISTFSPQLLHEVRNFDVKLSRIGSFPAAPGTRN